ncbi:MAG: DAK2 domain-containing protein [Nocardioidaceae bacterium]
MTQPLGLSLFQRWCEACVDALGVAREEIDALNVYPVPDGDTGTNLFLTLEAAAAATRTATADADLDGVGRAFVDGALRGARGNSGVIMSQLLRACVRPTLAGRDADGRVAPGTFASAMAAAASAAYSAVGQPVEGTILTVARVAADAAGSAATAGGDLQAVATAAADAARLALARTPEQLDQLRRAGVVDAGGRGLCVVLDATVRVMTGRWSPDAQLTPAKPTPAQATRAQPTRGSQTTPRPAAAGALAASGPGYEVMFLLDAADDRIPALRSALADLGESLVVVGGDGLWNVHVHVDEVGAVLERALEAGRPYRISVTHFAEPAARQAGRSSATRAVVAVAAGPGLTCLFEQAGARVVPSMAGLHCSTGELLDAINSSGADEVVVLPNDAGSLVAAEAAAAQARDAGVRVSVIPTRVQVQGLAALAVHEPGRSFDDDVVAMTAAAGQTRHGAVTVAAGRAMTSAGPCEPGDVLGVIAGDFALVGSDLGEVAHEVVRRLLVGGGELLTLVTGKDAPSGLTEGIQQSVSGERPEVDTVVYEGGQWRYPLLVAVE